MRHFSVNGEVVGDGGEDVTDKTYNVWHKVFLENRMSQNPSVLELECENRCPDCLWMTLKGIPQQQARRFYLLSSSSADIEQIELNLNINFNEQWEPLRAGRIKFGLRSGELRLNLDNGKIPLENRELNDPFEVSVKKDRQHQEGCENQSSLEASFAKGEPGIKANRSEKNTEGQTDKFQLTAFQVTTKGAEETPAWVFEVATREPVLKGSLTNQKLATMNVTAKPCEVKATFDISVRDVMITDAEGAWLTNLIPEKRTALDIALAKLLLKHKLQSPLSQVYLRHD
ncbi:MAG: hypothetical protein F6K14_17815 [Symploca sp. SIO2C1]|nr:hypothetical protein [Symploca sp. SIO2C1]